MEGIGNTLVLMAIVGYGLLFLVAILIIGGLFRFFYYKYYKKDKLPVNKR